MAIENFKFAVLEQNKVHGTHKIDCKWTRFRFTIMSVQMIQILRAGFGTPQAPCPRTHQLTIQPHKVSNATSSLTQYDRHHSPECLTKQQFTDLNDVHTFIVLTMTSNNTKTKQY